MSLQIKGFTAFTKPGQAHIHLFMPSDCCHQSELYKLPPPTSSSIGNLLMHVTDQFSDVARQLISLCFAPARCLSSLIHTNRHINTPLCKHTSHFRISHLIGGDDTVSHYAPTWATGGLGKVAWKRPCRLIMIWLVFMPSSRDAAVSSGGSWRFMHNCSSGITHLPSYCSSVWPASQIPGKQHRYMKELITSGVWHGKKDANPLLLLPSWWKLLPSWWIGSHN